jgi:hypothetical protein
MSAITREAHGPALRNLTTYLIERREMKGQRTALAFISHGYPMHSSSILRAGSYIHRWVHAYNTMRWSCCACN